MRSAGGKSVDGEVALWYSLRAIRVTSPEPAQIFESAPDLSPPRFHREGNSHETQAVLTEAF